MGISLTVTRILSLVVESSVVENLPVENLAVERLAVENQAAILVHVSLKVTLCKLSA